MVKVPSDPAQITANHAVFRVQFRPAQQPRSARVARSSHAAARAWEMQPSGGGGYRAVGAGAGREAAGAGAGGASGALVARRSAPVVWTGRSAPGDPGATGLLQAVRTTGREPGDHARDGLTQSLTGPGGTSGEAPYDATVTRFLPRPV